MSILLTSTAVGTVPLSILVPLICLGVLLLVGLGFLAKHINTRYSVLKDVSSILASAKLITTSHYYSLSGTTMADVWERRVDASPNAVFMVFEGVEWRYGDVEHLANRLAHWLKTQGIGRGQVIALMLGNCPQYVAVWLAAMKLGATTALVNTALRGQQLAHSLRVAEARLVICDTPLSECVVEAARWLLPEESEDSDSNSNRTNDSADRSDTPLSTQPPLLVATLADCGPATVLEATDTLRRVALADRASLSSNAASSSMRSGSPGARVGTQVSSAVQRQLTTDGSLQLGVEAVRVRDVDTGGRPVQLLSLDALFARDTALALSILHHTAPQVLASARAADMDDAANDGPLPTPAAALTAAIAAHSEYPAARPPLSWRKGSCFTDVGLLIYTSGTTGLPKAAALRHNRIYGSGFLFRHRYSFRDDDRLLTPLPLYHSAGGVVSVVATILGGGSLVVLRRFSASAFWEQCTRSGATVVQYIGELCRYLTLSPPSPFDRAHKVRLAFGNGLRADVWREFMERFHVPEIGEFYASTEGNAGLFHHFQACPCILQRWAAQRGGAAGVAVVETTDSAAATSDAAQETNDKAKETAGVVAGAQWDCPHARAVGAVGHMGPLVRFLSGMALLRYDRARDELVRGKDGLCEACEADEPGEMAAKIVPWDPVRTFSGYYNNRQGSKSKTVTDVLRRGDIYFRTGDLLREDARGYWFFVDRVGDTFRWKGENVSTHEVEQVVARADKGVRDACVYGAEVPGAEGRACMVALRFGASDGAGSPREGEGGAQEKSGEAGELIDHRNFDWAAWEANLSKELPAYAVPLFVRVLSAMAVTGTFKYQKGDLRDQGADPMRCTDPLLVRACALTPGAVGYVPLTASEWGRITAGQAKL